MPPSCTVAVYPAIAFGGQEHTGVLAAEILGRVVAGLVGVGADDFIAEFFFAAAIAQAFSGFVADFAVVAERPAAKADGTIFPPVAGRRSVQIFL